MRNQRKFGNIYLPENQNQKTVGAWLNLINDSISIDTPAKNLNHKNFTIILGEFNDFGKATFINNFTNGGSWGSGGVHQKIEVSYCIKGQTISSYSELVFDRFVLVSPALIDWVTERKKLDFPNENTIQIPALKKIAEANMEGGKIFIWLDYARTSSIKGLNLTKTCNVIIELNERAHIEEYDKIMTSLKKLILFLTHKNPEFSKYFVAQGESQYELINSNQDLEDHKFSQGLGLCYSDIKDQLSEIIEEWFKIEKLYPTIDLLLERNFNVKLSNQSYFLNSCVAMESFHRIKGKSNRKKAKLDKPEYKAKLIKLIGDDEELLEWFKINSKEWEKPTLHMRLNEYKTTLESLAGDSLSFGIEALIKKAKQTRNDMAHEGNYTKRFSYTELFIVSKIFEYTIKLEILKILGVEIDTSVESNNRIFLKAKNNIKLLTSLNQELLEKDKTE